MSKNLFLNIAATRPPEADTNKIKSQQIKLTAKIIYLEEGY